MTEPAMPPSGARALPLRRWGLFILIGLLLYAGLYAGSEALVYRFGNKNRFFMVKAAGSSPFDVAIVGASHAMPFDFEDMNDRLQQAIGGKILNLSLEGAGILPNRLILEYFLRKHQVRSVVIFLDSFAFYSPRWNEERIGDAKLLQRAPFDVELLGILSAYPSARQIMLQYATGLLKVNNHDRFAPDISEAELTRFGRTYRSIPQIDRQRVAYLYPATVDQTLFKRYLDEFESLIRLVRRHNADVIVLKPPTPRRYRDKLPNEAEFDAAVKPVVAAQGATFHDLSTALPDDRYYYDTDHLNRAGVMSLIDGAIGDLLRRPR